MISLFQGRGDILLGLGTKDALVGTQEFIDILPWGHAHGSVFFPNKVTTKMKADWTCTLKLELILVLQYISDSLGVLGSCSNVVHVYADVLVYIAILSHPDVRFSLAWVESHVCKTVSKVLMPMEARSPEAIECLR